MTADLQKRLIQFAIHTLSVLESDRDWNSDTIDAVNAGATELELCTFDDDGYFKSIVTESGEDIRVHPFTQEELIALLEAARVALADANTYDYIALSFGISDDGLKSLQEKLNNHMNK